MLEELHFKRTEVVTTDAAVLGVARSQWHCLPQGASVEAAHTLMSTRRFDVVPIDEGKGVRSYFATKAWNDFSSVEMRLLGRDDVLDFRTPVRTVVHAFATHPRQFFFLVNGVDVVGLLSIAHLNSRSAKTYLYALVADLEYLLGRYVEVKLPTDACVAELRKLDNDDQAKEALSEHKAAIRTGTDVRLVEHLYLRHLMKLSLAAHLHDALNWSRASLKKKLNSIIDLRNVVAHPARTLVRGPADVKKLWKRVSIVEDIAFTVRTHLMSGAREGAAT